MVKPILKPILNDALSSIIPFEQVKNYVYRLDGITNRITLSEPLTIPENLDFELKFNIKGSGSGFEGILEGVDFWVRFLGDGQINNIQGYLDGSYFSAFPYSNYVIRNGESRLLSISRVNSDLYMAVDSDIPSLVMSGVSKSLSIDTFGAYSSAEFEGFIYNISLAVDGSTVNEIPLTNKEQGAVQLPTVGSVSATIVNYTEDEWEEV